MPQENKNQPCIREMFAFLDALRASGQINMMGAGPYLAREFNLDRFETRDYMMKWIKRDENKRKLLES